MPKGIYKRKPNIKYAKYWSGKEFSSTHREKLSLAKKVLRGSEVNGWKGEKAGYRAKHTWIARYYGQPTTCEHCQTGNLTGHSIHWACKTKEYKRERENWLRLCAKCHALFDKVNNLRHKK